MAKKEKTADWLLSVLTSYVNDPACPGFNSGYLAAFLDMIDETRVIDKMPSVKRKQIKKLAVRLQREFFPAADKIPIQAS